MSVAVKVSVTHQVRALKAAHPYLSAEDISALTQLPPAKVRQALAVNTRRRIKSVAPRAR